MERFTARKISGRVVKGKSRGKGLGFPTANLALEAGQLPPDFGVYAGAAFVKGKKFKAAISYGPAKTFDESEPVLEAYLFDFDGDLYGQTMQVELFSKVGEIKKCLDAAELVKKIQDDCAKVLQYLCSRES